ncbi:hypothetical protein L0152_07245 [bacterium]|nr:hypothetical protein [bacterium]
MKEGISILGLDEARNTVLKLEEAVTPDRQKMDLIGQVLYDSVQLNFAVRGRPDPWPPYADSTLLRAGRRIVKKQTRSKFKKLSATERGSAFRSAGAGSRSLQFSGKLLKSIEPIAGEDFAKAKTDVFYGRFHEFGTGKMPQAKFLLIQDEDAPEIERILLEPIDEALR